MEEVIREYLESAKFGRKQVYKNLAVFDLRDRLVADYASYTRSFNAVLHYDLACYPTRYEQREGRVTIQPVLSVDILGAYVLVPIPGKGGGA